MMDRTAAFTRMLTDARRRLAEAEAAMKFLQERVRILEEVQSVLIGDAPVDAGASATPENIDPPSVPEAAAPTSKTESLPESTSPQARADAAERVLSRAGGSPVKFKDLLAGVSAELGTDIRRNQLFSVLARSGFSCRFHAPSSGYWTLSAAPPKTAGV